MLPAQLLGDTLIELFESHVRRQPQRVAVTSDSESLSYTDLDSQSSALAATLLQHGVSPGDRVGLYTRRSPQLVVGVLGIMKAGAAYVPIDPENPAERNAYIANDAGITALVTDGSSSTGLVSHERHIPAVSLRHRQHELTRALQVPSSIAYVIYTSGTTGTPKGVPIPTSNVVTLLRSALTLFDFRPTDTWTMFHSYAFDFSVWEMWGALATGARLALVPFWTSRMPEEFLQLLEAEQVSVLNQTPSAFATLIHADSWRQRPLNAPLRYVIFGGEPLYGSSLLEWARRYGLDRPAMVNMYGITETTIHATFRRVTTADLTTTRSVIGHPLPTYSLRLLDEHGQEVPDGTVGEIYVEGPCVAPGYLNRPNLTAQRFVEFADSNGRFNRMYRSGDLALRRDDGCLVYIGRNDEQVKIRGHRIELGEVEASLRALTPVRDAAVWVVDLGKRDRRLCAAVVPGERHTAVDERQLRRELGKSLPSYMIPSRFFSVEELPLTVNGKVDRGELLARMKGEMVFNEHERATASRGHAP